MSLSSLRLRPLVAPSITFRRHNCSAPTAVRSGALGFNASDHNVPVKNWNKFYRRHQNKFFKDRHYLEKDWGKYFSGGNSTSSDGEVVLEVGCGAGNTIFPLTATYPNLFVHACDFSPYAVALVKSHMDFSDKRINVFICDVTNDDLCDNIMPSSIDVATLVQLQNRNQMIGDNFYVRGDGTCSFFFSEDFLSTLFIRAGFSTVDMSTYCRQIENRSRNVIMSRRWIRAIFSPI